MKSLNVCIPVSPSLFWPNSKISFIKSKSWSVFAWWSSSEIEFERQMGGIVKIQVPRKLWGKERSRRSDLCRGIGFRCGDMFLHLPLLKATQTRESGIIYSPKPTSHTNEDENMLWKDLSLWMIKKEACTQGNCFYRKRNGRKHLPNLGSLWVNLSQDVLLTTGVAKEAITAARPTCCAGVLNKFCLCCSYCPGPAM